MAASLISEATTSNTVNPDPSLSSGAEMTTGHGFPIVGRDYFDAGGSGGSERHSFPSWRMQLLALSGDRGVALAQYERCRHVLWRELGVDPTAETQALFERTQTYPFAPCQRDRSVYCIRP